MTARKPVMLFFKSFILADINPTKEQYKNNFLKS